MKDARGFVSHRHGVVYLVTCDKSDLVYVGKTTNYHPRARWAQHLAEVKRGSSSKFHEAIREHGEGAFSFQVIACVLPGVDIEKFEADVIEQFKSDTDGYNTSSPKFWEQRSAYMSAAQSALFRAGSKIGYEKVIALLNEAAR